MSRVLQAQRDYLSNLNEGDVRFALAVEGAFVRGMRNIGYWNTGTALDELIDNAIQADAKNILVLLATAGEDQKPVAIAIVDHGHGMDPEMVRPAASWGGTGRENDRTGFGRYG